MKQWKKVLAVLLSMAMFMGIPNLVWANEGEKHLYSYVFHHILVKDNDYVLVRTNGYTLPYDMRMTDSGTNGNV